MAKTTIAGGASATEHEMTDPPIVFRRPEMGLVDQPTEVASEDEEESPSGGTHSSPSLVSEPKSNEHSTRAPRKPVQTTENPSNQPETVQGSSADSTGGDGQRETRKRSGRPATKAAPVNPRAARIRSTDEVDEFDI